MKIFKYPLEDEDQQQIMLPVNAEILTVQMQGNTLCLWAKVDETAHLENRREERTIEQLGTGWPLNDDKRRYLGTIQRGPLVWHVFEKEQV